MRRCCRSSVRRSTRRPFSTSRRTCSTAFVRQEATDGLEVLAAAIAEALSGAGEGDRLLRAWCFGQGSGHSHPN